MKDLDISAGVRAELGNIAPEIDMKSVDPSANLREALDINSMDFLNFVTTFHHSVGINIPEIDYPKLSTLDGVVNYLAGKLR